jgi:hypothetical protein
MQLGSGNLPLVPFGDSLVHDKQYNIPAAPYEPNFAPAYHRAARAEPPEQIPPISSWPKNPAATMPCSPLCDDDLGDR